MRSVPYCGLKRKKHDEKLRLMLIGKRQGFQESISISTEDTEFERVQSFKYLSVIINELLS